MTGNPAIIGLGVWLPDRVKTNDEWPDGFPQGNASDGDRTFSDIGESADPIAAELVRRNLEREADDPFLASKERRIADPSDTSYDAEAFAAAAAMDDAGITPAGIGALFSHAMLPDAVGSTSATEVARRLGVHGHALVVDTACASAVSQLEPACAYVRSGTARTVLCTQSHLLTRSVPDLHPASPSIGDIATAYVVGDGPGLEILSTFTMTHGEYADAVRWVRGRKPSPTDPPWFLPGDTGFRLGSHAPPEVKLLMRETVNYGADAITKAAESAGIDVHDIDLLCCVQPRGFIPGAIAERLGLPAAAGITTYESIAHVGASGPVYNLIRARDDGRITEGTTIAMYAQGMGFVRSAAILRMT